MIIFSVGFMVFSCISEPDNSVDFDNLSEGVTGENLISTVSSIVFNTRIRFSQMSA